MSHEVQTGAEAPSVRLERVTKRFGDFAAVREMDLDIPRGQFFTMLGPSGCGKTTTLRMVAGFEEPTEGSVYLDGDDGTFGSQPDALMESLAVRGPVIVMGLLDVPGVVA